MSEYKGTKKPPRSSKRIIIIYEGGSREYTSISEAARSTGISRQRIIRALKRSDGFIPCCPFSVDFSLSSPSAESRDRRTDSIKDDKKKNLRKITADKAKKSKDNHFG